MEPSSTVMRKYPISVVLKQMKTRYLSLVILPRYYHNPLADMVYQGLVKLDDPIEKFFHLILKLPVITNKELPLRIWLHTPPLYLIPF
ncbi:MAG: hypothetical protein AB7V56_15675 [Candidatus Nitrosocosmicus sp.]|jgi:hypothetical protein|nr:hypothetical protein [Candidatus Nitrosocosmicus sp.]